MDKEQQVEWARQYLVDGWMSYANLPGQAWTTAQNTDKRKSGMNPSAQWHTLPSRILTASPFLHGISGHEELLDELLESMPLLEDLEVIERVFS